ncbi:hypothetical protein FQR65_LT13298 [Abscondita terminalis]|nr:hypothetical protein FQR65_LT13298 [Abscondita terminalis]
MELGEHITMGQIPIKVLIAHTTKPLPVNDFECISYNYENLTCTWTAPQNYAKTSYTLKYYHPARASRHARFRCPEIEEIENQRKMLCTWTIQSEPPYRQAQRTYYFELNMTNYFGSTQMNYTFSHFPHVLSGPPENASQISTTPESVYLRWLVPIGMQAFSSGLHHRIIYQSEFDKNWQLGGLLIKPTMDESGYIYFNLTNLTYAYCVYDIRISIRSAEAEPDDESMWSKNFSLAIRTDKKVPGRPPKTNIGSFEIVSTGTTLNQREVFIYWQQIPSYIINGPNFTYVVEIVGKNDIKPVEVTSGYAKFRNLSVDESYTFHLWSQNIVGRSDEKSVVVVPSQFERVREPASYTKIVYGDGKYELSWVTPNNLYTNTPIKNYTIFWCSLDRDPPYQCPGYLSWIEIPGDKKMFNITVSEVKIHQFAISANTENSSSGMVWAACTVIPNQAVGKMNNVRIAQVYETAVQVSWKLECSDRVGIVQGFVIYYCCIGDPSLINCPEQQLRINDSTTETVNITGLRPYQSYMFAVSVITKHNSQSQKSIYQYATTLEGAPTSPYDLVVSHITNSSISLSWSQPKSLNGKLEYYQIICNNSRYRVEPNVTECTIDELHSYTVYNISVIACTKHCSGHSPYILQRTLGGYPGQISRPGVTFQNSSFILIEWDKPDLPRGKNDVFEIRFKEKLKNGNRSNPIINVTATKFSIEDCGSDGKINSFYVSVRAVNIVNSLRYEGPWSEELESVCRTTEHIWIWLFLPISVIFVVGGYFIGKKAYFRYREMRNVEVMLPPGLITIGSMDITLKEWGSFPNIQEDDGRPPSADEISLLKRAPNQFDSSGCSSGHESHESVRSHTESGTSSDSGWEQPRSGSAEDTHESYLRLRNVAPKGYVTMPPENSVWSPKIAPGNYCTLDSVMAANPPTNAPGVPPAEPLKTLPQTLPDPSNPPSLYVLTGHPTPSEPYVMAGNNAVVLQDLVRLEAIKAAEEKPYVQIANQPGSVVNCCHPVPVQVVVAVAPPEPDYVTIGEPSKPPCNEPSKSGYIPHKQFEAKALKKD